MKSEADMDAALQRIDRLIISALEQLDYLRGTEFERYAEEMLDVLVCHREKYVHYLSLLN